MKFWANAMGYQAVWFAAVIGAGRGVVWPGVVTALLFAAWQWSVSAQRNCDAKLIAVALACGLLLDGGLTSLGLAHYAAPWSVAWLAPAWILALWAAFALTINHSLRLLQNRVWLAAVFGAVGGPLAYFAAERGFAAVDLLTPTWQALACLAFTWSAATSLLVYLARCWQQDTSAPSMATNMGVR